MCSTDSEGGREVGLTTGGECTVNRMKIDIIHGKDEGLIFRARCLIAPVALEGKVIPGHQRESALG
jgi:hypothetical protein